MSTTSFSRGIDPELLASQVKNTMPYLFEAGPKVAALISDFPPARVLYDYDRSFPRPELSHFEYFRLCLCSHYLSCATPVPTDVDNQIRKKLWPGGLAFQEALRMADLVLESRSWDFTQVTSRSSTGATDSPQKSEVLCGHLGEWFTVAAGAYCAMKHYSSGEARKKEQEIHQAVGEEIKRHAEVFGSLWRANAGLGALQASASVAHNLGDLDRVMDLWELGPGDPFRVEFYKLGIVPFTSQSKLRYGGKLWVAGELYKESIEESSMSMENHRHFALRKPRSLRSDRDLLIPLGPFFDSWGEKAASLLDEPSIMDLIHHLKQGWVRLPKTLGYGRALHGILQHRPELRKEIYAELSSWHHLAIQRSRENFEKSWEQAAIQLMDEIPSRAS